MTDTPAPAALTDAALDAWDALAAIAEAPKPPGEDTGVWEFMQATPPTRVRALIAALRQARRRALTLGAAAEAIIAEGESYCPCLYCRNYVGHGDDCPVTRLRAAQEAGHD